MKKKAQSYFLNFHWETVHETQVPEQRLSQKGILFQSITYGSFLRFTHIALRAHWCHASGPSSIYFQLEAEYGIVCMVQVLQIYRWEELPDCGTSCEVAEEQ